MVEIARKGKYQEWIEPDGLLMLEGWARDGLTDEQIAKNIGVNVRTIYDWKDRYPQFSQALKKGRGPVDVEVENALLKRAKGYTVTLRKPIKVRVEKRLQGKGTIIEETIQYAEEEMHVPADTTAQIFWLKHRKAKRWGDMPKGETGHDVEDLSPLVELLR